jgi:hypothetical protein
MVGDVGVDAAQGYLAKADCDGPQFREISINLRLTQLLPRLYTQKLVCGVALHQAEIKPYKTLTL